MYDDKSSGAVSLARTLAGLLIMAVTSVLLVTTPAGKALADEPSVADASEARVPGKVFDPDRTPVRPVPEDRWGELEPVLPTNCKAIGLSDPCVYLDSSGKEGEPHDSPFPQGVSVTGGYAFYATGQGLYIFDVSDPTDPERFNYVDASLTAPVWGFSDKNFFMKSVAAPPGNASILAVTAEDFGVLIANTTNKKSVQWYYQDDSAFGGAVNAISLGGRDYALAVVSDSGVVAYDMTEAKNYSMCTQESGKCIGVRKGVAAPGAAGTSIATSGHWLAVLSVDNIIIADISNLGNLPSTTIPQRINSTMPDTGVNNGQIGLWENGGQLYLAANTWSGTVQKKTSRLKIFNVSCVMQGNCSLPAATATYDTPSGATNSTVTNTLDVSIYNSTPYIYAGGTTIGGNCVTQREYLLDASNVNNLRDVTPGSIFKNTNLGYWGWYYDCLTGGYNNAAPLHAVMNDQGYLFRAMYSFGDVHKLVGSCAEPNADFTWSADPEAGQPVSFTDQSTCDPDTWSWTFEDGVPASVQGSLATDQNPTVTFQSSGNKSVSLVATNNSGDSPTVFKTVTVAEPPDPNPHVTDITVDTTEAFVCSAVTFTANGISGATPLTVSWDKETLMKADLTIFTDGFEFGDTLDWTTTTGLSALRAPTVARRSRDTAVRPSGAGARQGLTLKATENHVWNVPQDAMPGTYTITVHVSNSVDQIGESATSAEITIKSLPTLRILGEPTADSTTATVAFNVATQGATEWYWDFGDGSNSGWISDPIAGPSPTHGYSEGGPKTVTVKVRNCQAAAITKVLEIDVPTPNPLVIQTFSAQCSLGFCSFDVNETITFDVVVDGNPTLYEYDWNSTDGVFTTVNQSSATAVTTHSYSAAGNYLPVLRISRTGESVDKAQSKTLVISGGAPPPPPPPPPPSDLSVDSFASACPLGNCAVASGTTITFSISVTGTPDTYQYDWTSTDGVFRTAQQSSTSPITSHVFTTGCYRPAVRIVQGSDSDTGADIHTLNVGGGCGGGGADLGITTFKADCGGLCSFPVNTMIIFDVVVTGSPTLYEYDWDSPNGTFDGSRTIQSSAIPITNHTYTVGGQGYKPVLRVTKDAETVDQADQNTSLIGIQN